MVEEEEDESLVCPYCHETYESGKCHRCVWGEDETTTEQQISDGGYCA